MTATRERKYLKCRECGRVIVDWDRIAHWQIHNPNHPHANCCGSPRGEVAAMFEEVQR